MITGLGYSFDISWHYIKTMFDLCSEFDYEIDYDNNYDVSIRILCS
jgi:hypothetical protein